MYIHWKQVASVLLVCCLLLALSGSMTEGKSATSTPAAGVVRVLLSRLALTDRVDLQLDGSYTVGDMNLSFQRGSKLTVSCASGNIMLYHEGMALNSGKSVTLKRHGILSDEENGIRINGNYALYTGDLVLSVYSGMLRAVLYAPVEEYLMGVVPNEMSDSFPLEALKAQAVTARTYALRKAGSSLDYDLVDTTDDQVYKGANYLNKRAQQAIAETAGICGYYKGALAECFYSASNGGQTELVHNVWGTGDYSYLQSNDDPYDIENPESVVSRYTISKAASGVSGNETLHSLLMGALPEAVAAKGYDDERNNIRIASVVGITPHTALFQSPSKVFSMLRFDLLVDGKRLLTSSDMEDEVYFPDSQATVKPSVQPQSTPGLSGFTRIPGKVSVDIPYFGELENALGLSINSGNNELVSVVENENSFELQARRYGHGVGMSQRGAQWMAEKYAWTYEQILRFYYPGMTLKAIQSKTTLPPPVAAEYLATPGPAATPTPRPTPMPVLSELGEGQWRVKVTLIEENSYLNLREKPNMQCGVLMRLYYGQELIVISTEADGWLRVKTDTVEGYVMEKFVEKQE